MKKLVYSVLVFLVAYVFAPALFERFAPRHWVRAFRRVTMALYRPWAGVGPGWAVIETIGRKSGQPRQTPVGGRLSGDNYWFVAIDGRQSHFVRNIEARPEVRVRVHGLWRSGIAVVLPGDDARRRLWQLNPLNSLFLSTYGGLDPLTIRVDLREELRDLPTRDTYDRTSD